MNMIPVLARAFGVDPVCLQRAVEEYENPNSGDCLLCHGTGTAIPTSYRGPFGPCPLCRDRLALIKRRHEEAGRGDADKQWLIEEVERLRIERRGVVAAALDEALNSGDGVYRP